MMRTNHLTTSTPKRRSARSRKPATKDDLSVGNLSDISIVSSVCSPIRDVETSSKTKSIIKTGHSSQDKNRKKKTVEFDLSSTDYDEPNDRSLSHDSSLNFRRPLGVRSGALNQHNLRRSNRKPAKDDFKLLEKPAKLLESGKRKRTSNKVNKTTNENRPNVKRTRNSNNLHQNGNQNEHDPVRQFTGKLNKSLIDFMLYDRTKCD